MTRIETHLPSAEARTPRSRDRAFRPADDALGMAPSNPGASGSDPEQQFAAGWSACFIGAMLDAAEAMQITLPARTAVDAEVDLDKSGDAYVLEARLNVSLPGLSRGAAAALVEAAHELCPYGETIRGAVDVAIDLN